ncbi:CapA family protein [uncultured Butyricimonas sp.]|uniref:CapA family protein n=1 Tax=uncultured Butyricimonas sp. TaxID=1268785 RepID=UPI0026DD1770|nr:CapA family protein [uncultured Butyricimonas sp.]
MNKITFIGDITCDRPLLNAAYDMNSGSYDFSPVFGKVKSLFADSDYVVGNFETVCGGDKNGFQNQYMLCNSPDELIQAMVKGGINCVTMANNHCLDQGIEGLVRTIDELDKNKVLHTGTFKYEDASNRVLYLYLNDIVVALISNTYSTNASNTGIVLNDRNDFYVNLLKKQSEFTFVGKRRWAKRFLFKLINARYRRTINRIVARLKLKQGKVFLKPRGDVIVDGDTDNKYLKLLVEDLKIARDNADYVIVCSHFGGQFNEIPGAYSKFIGDFVLEHGADMLIGNHPHVIQKVKRENGKSIAYSLGSFNQSPSADYIIHDALPEYSMAFHVYFSKDRDNVNTRAITFSILKAVEDSNKMLVVYPINKLYDELEKNKRIQLEEDVKIIYKRITGQSILKNLIQNEYVLM